VVHALRQPGEQALGLARRFGEHALVRGLGLRQVAERPLRRDDLPLLEELAHPLPYVGDLDPVFLPEERCQLLAALRQLGRVEPHLLRLGERRFVIAGDAREPGVAADPDVVAGIFGRLALEFLPVGALAEHLQPVAAQQLRDIGIAVRGEKRPHFARLGVLQLERKPQVLDPGREDVPLELLRVARELHRVARTVGVEHTQEVEVRLLRTRCRERERPGQQGQEYT